MGVVLSVFPPLFCICSITNFEVFCKLLFMSCLVFDAFADLFVQILFVIY